MRASSCALRHDLGPHGRGARLGRFGGGELAHPRPDDGEGAEEEDPHHQQPALRALADGVPHRLVAQADVLALDGIGILALLAGLQDAGERAKGRAAHRRSSSMPLTSTGSRIGPMGVEG